MIAVMAGVVVFKFMAILMTITFMVCLVRCVKMRNIIVIII